MIRNFIKIAFRNIVRYKLHSIINIGGLAIGISIFTLIIIYAVSELSYNKYHKNYDRIYQLSINNELSTTAHIGYTLKGKFPEIEYLVRIDYQYGGGKEAYLKQLDSDKLIEFKDIIYSNPDFFNIFSVKPIAGDLTKALKNPYSLVLTKSSAMKLFGSIDVINKTVEFISGEGRIIRNFTITAIIEDTPKNSLIKYSGIASFISLNDIKPGGIEVDKDYYNWGYHTFIMPNKKAKVEKLTKKAHSEFVNFICEKYDLTPDNEEVKEITLELIPLSKVPFYGNKKLQFIYLIISIGVVIILIAIINFINLSLAKSSLRNKEIGLRKVVGSSRKILIQQFIGEAILMVMISVIFSLIFTEILKPFFNNMVGKELSIGYIENPFVLVIFFVGALIIGILAGFYPAIILSGFSPLKTIKNEVNTGKKGHIFKQTLSIIQITVSLVLIIGVIIISNQIKFMKTKDLGFDSSNIVYFRSNDFINEKYDVFKEKLLQNPNIYKVSRSGNEFGECYHITVDVELNGIKKQAQAMVADPDFVETMGLEIVEGRNYKWDRTDDIGGVLMNETAAKEFGGDSIIGKRLELLGDKQHILGIYKDVHNESFHQKITPSILFNYSLMFHRVNIKLNGNKTKEAITHIEKLWNETVPDVPFKYNFLDEKYNKLYKTEEKFGMVIQFSAAFSIFIACLGLFGIISFTSERRKKEIGIRKTNGATTKSILFLLNKNIIKWVAIATILACPIAYYSTNKWLQSFAYKTPFDIGVYILAFFIVLSIALLSVAIVVFKAAKTNPAECLRYE